MPDQTPPEIDQFAFLVQLVKQLDAFPADNATGALIARSLGVPDPESAATAEAIAGTVQRLKQRALIDFRPGPFRGGDGWTHRALMVTPAGYEQASAAAAAPARSDQSSGETWSWRDLPVLRAAVTGVDANPEIGIRFREVATDTGLPIDEVYRAAKALQSDGLVALREYAGGGEASSFDGISGRARREVGAWPTPETAVDRLLDALEHLAENAPDEPTRSKARSAWQQAGGLGRDTLASVLATVLTGQLPGAGG